MTTQLLERRILALAAGVVADPVQVDVWYRSDPIAALGGRTAHALVAAGAGREVVAFLLDVLVQERARCDLPAGGASLDDGGAKPGGPQPQG
ncbi:hypothetical protein LDO31_00815 [Luteimonas sp. XNQY3]|nr:hypothetical protein [Luteimonas sp. XNQY3]MCD9004793.1 hypothetical protein [Luteimonas sp. XNQY3]